MKKKYYNQAFLLLIVFSSISVSFCQTIKYENKKEKIKDGKTILITYRNGRIIKKITTQNNGIRDGLSEEWKIDSLDNEFQYSQSLYSNGILVEESFYARKNILTEKYVYSNGLLIYDIKLINIDKNNNLHYIKKLYNYNSFRQYSLINNIIIDSIDVK